MSASAFRARFRVLAFVAAALLALAQGAAAQQHRPPFTQRELDQMLAPIALYPDTLLSQILMASTYPLEVAEAARWSRAHPHLSGDDAVRAVAERDWDPSVKSLVAFPHLLQRMDEKLEWTRDLGDAFLAQEPQVMETIQALRRRARAAGTLASDERVRVVPGESVIVIEPAYPDVVYVPYYDPWVAYGPWWWPAYAPVYWLPWPGYVVHYPRPGYYLGHYRGPAIRVSLGFFFGNFDWHRRRVCVVNVTNYYYRPHPHLRRDGAFRGHAQVAGANGALTPWRHDPWHRRRVAYREAAGQTQHAQPPREEHRERRPERRDPGRDEHRERRREWQQPQREERRENRGQRHAPPPATLGTTAPQPTMPAAARVETRSAAPEPRPTERRPLPPQARPLAPEPGSAIPESRPPRSHSEAPRARPVHPHGQPTQWRTEREAAPRPEPPAPRRESSEPRGGRGQGRAHGGERPRPERHGEKGRFG